MERELAAHEVRITQNEQEIERLRSRMHDLESLEAAVGMLADSMRNLSQSIASLPVTVERVGVLSTEMKNVKRALWSFTFALVGSAIGFAFFAIQIASGGG